MIIDPDATTSTSPGDHRPRRHDLPREFRYPGRAQRRRTQGSATEEGPRDRRLSNTLGKEDLRQSQIFREFFPGSLCRDLSGGSRGTMAGGDWRWS